MSRYNYKPLHLPYETRALVVSPGTFDDPLEASIVHISLVEDETPYEALSYCWAKSVLREPPDMDTMIQCSQSSDRGACQLPFRELIHYPEYRPLYYQMGGPPIPGRIKCDGVDMEIGAELGAALRRLRREDEPLPIWVDALCINQLNPLETNDHVNMIGVIYAKATSVRIWLGEEHPNDHDALDDLQSLNETFIKALSTNTDEDPWIKRDNVNGYVIRSGILKKIKWENIARLLNRAWFTRVWVFQEVAKARRTLVHIGSQVYDWEVISAPLMNLRVYSMDWFLTMIPGVKSLCTMSILRSTERSSMRLLWLIEDLRGTQSTLPCDKIYGILGLVPDGDDIEVDYRKTDTDIYRDFAITYLVKRRDLNLLYHCVWSPDSPLLSLPSWVPDWARAGQVESFYTRSLTANAAASTVLELQIDESGQILYLSGKIVDTVQAVEQMRIIPTPGPITKDDINTLQGQAEQTYYAKMDPSWSNNDVWFLSSYKMAFPNNDEIPDPKVFENWWRSLMCNRTRFNDVPDPECSLGAIIHLQSILDERPWEEGERFKLPDYMKKGIPKVNPLNSREHQLFQSGILKWTYGRRFCRSEGGRFGWVVDGTAVGDVFFIPFGGDYALVLRPTRPNSFMIIGDAYLHGVMEGGAMDDDMIPASTVRIS